MSDTTTCEFETANGPECDAAATVTFTVAYVEDGTPTTHHTYRVCAGHEKAILADIADTPWEIQ